MERGRMLLALQRMCNVERTKYILGDECKPAGVNTPTSRRIPHCLTHPNILVVMRRLVDPADCVSPLSIH